MKTGGLGTPVAKGIILGAVALAGVMIFDEDDDNDKGS